MEKFDFLKEVGNYQKQQKKVRRILHLAGLLIGTIVTIWLLFNYDWELILGIFLLMFANNLSRT